MFGSPTTSAASCSIRPTIAPCAVPMATIPRGWNGKIIVVFPTMVDMRGKMTPGLRVRIPPPKQQQAALAPEPVQSGNGARHQRRRRN